MRRNFIRNLAILLVIAVFCVGNAYALNPIPRNDSGRVTVGQNGYGDVLMGQIYQSLEDYETKIKVVNSSSTMAVVAHVSFRSALLSCDVFDFPIYLTPTDMWEATVRMNDSGNVEIYSTDDSVLSSEKPGWVGTEACNPFDGVWANEVPLQREFYTDCLDATIGDVNTFGHFEVIGVAAYFATPPLSKDTLAMLYGNIPGVPAIPPARLLCDYNVVDGIIRDVPNVLTGTVTLKNSMYGGQQAAINLLALKNYNNLPDPGWIIGQEYPLSNTTFNSVVEIEAALAKTEYVVPFDFDPNVGDSEVVLINTLPTRYETDDSGYPGLEDGVCGLMYQVYDMSETIVLDFLSGDVNVECLPEVSMQPLRRIVEPAFQYGYAKGWIRANIDTQGGGSGLSAAGRNDMDVRFEGVNNGTSFLVYQENALSYGQGAGFFAGLLAPALPAPDTYAYIHRVTYTGVPSINSSLTITSDNDMIWNYAASPESIVQYIEDVDQDGKIDTVHEDMNGNGVLDTGEDKNNNGVIDAGEDQNANGRLDIWLPNGAMVADEDIAPHNNQLDVGEDLNGNGVLDTHEDIDNDNVLDLKEDPNLTGVNGVIEVRQ